MLKDNFRESLTRSLTSFSDIVISSQKGIYDLVFTTMPQIISFLVGFASSILIARGLGPAGLGNYSLVMSISSVAGSLSDMGIGQTAIRYASRYASIGDTKGQHSILRWAFRLRMLLVLLTTIIAFLIVPIVVSYIWHTEYLAFPTRLSLLSGIFAAIAAVPSIYFQSMKRFGVNATVAISQTIISFIGILLLYWLNNWTVLSVVLVGVITSALGAAIFLFLIPKEAIFVFNKGKLNQNFPIYNFLKAPSNAIQGKNTVDSLNADKFAFYMIISSILVMITMRADVWLMGVYLDKSQIGVYGAAMKFTLPLGVLLGSLNTALWPRASSCTDFQNTVSLLKKTFLISLAIASFGFLYAFFVPMLAPVILGSDYSNSVLLGQLLCFRYILSILICPVGVVAYNFNYARVAWIINLLQCISVISVDIILMPKLGSIAPAIALIINELISLILASAFIINKIRKFN